MLTQWTLGVISDTHYPETADHFPFEELKRYFNGVDRILHAGDVTEPELLDILGAIAPVEAVAGNMDIALGDALPVKKILTFGKTRIGIAHGALPFSDPEDKIRYYFGAEKLDAFIFGHTHRAYNAAQNGVLYFNPGSPAKPAYPQQSSVGLLTITEQGIDARLVCLKPGSCG